MIGFSESLRYEYPLTQDSIVIDAGGYEGNWFRVIYERYGCHIHVFEPVYDYWLQCCLVAHRIAGKLPEENKIKVFRLGLGGSFKTESFGVSGDSAGKFCPCETKQDVSIVDASEIVRAAGDVDLLKLNIEGYEYDVIKDLVKSGQILRVKNIQVQCHFNFPEARKAYNEMRESLLKTHEPQWDSEPVWQNWLRKE